MANNYEDDRPVATREVHHDHGDRSAGAGTTLVSWLALILSILALALAWTAFNRTGEDLEQRIQDGVRNATQSVEQGVDSTTDDAAAPSGSLDGDTNTDTGTGTAPSDGTTDGTTDTQTETTTPQ